MKTSTKRELHHRANIHSPKQILQNFNTTVFINQKKKKKKNRIKIVSDSKYDKKRNKLNKISPPYKTWTKLYYYYSLLTLASAIHLENSIGMHGR